MLAPVVLLELLARIELGTARATGDLLAGRHGQTLHLSVIPCSARSVTLCCAGRVAIDIIPSSRPRGPAAASNPQRVRAVISATDHGASNASHVCPVDDCTR